MYIPTITSEFHLTAPTLEGRLLEMFHKSHAASTSLLFLLIPRKTAFENYPELNRETNRLTLRLMPVNYVDREGGQHNEWSLGWSSTHVRLLKFSLNRTICIVRC